MNDDKIQLVREVANRPADVAIVVVHHNKLPHLESLIARNPDCDIYLSENWRFADKKSSWLNADQPIYDFFAAVESPYQRYVFVEYDVYCTMGVRDYYRGYWDEDFVAQAVRFPWRDQYWPWFKQVTELPGKLRDVACGVVPLACLLMSRPCLRGICELKKEYEPAVFCELRIATLAARAGFLPISHHCRFGRVSWHDELIGEPDLSQPGFFHPMK